MVTNQVKIRSEGKVFCPKCQTEGKKSKVILYPGPTIPRMKYTDGYWNENGDFVEFNAEIELPSYICSNGHITPHDPKMVLSASTPPKRAINIRK
jgi:hypothetical protein